MAMNRETWHALGALHPLASVLTGGFELPALTTMERLGSSFGPFFGRPTSPIPLFVLLGVVLFGIWTAGRSRDPGIQADVRPSPASVP